MKRSTNKTNKTIRIMLVLMLAFTMVLGTGMPASAVMLRNATTDIQAEPADPVDTDDQVDTEDPIPFTTLDADTASDDGEADLSEPESDGESSGEDAVETVEEGADTGVAEAEDESEATTAGDFNVSGSPDAYEFDEENGVLYIKGDVEVSTDSQTTQSIIVQASCKVTLAGIDIKAAKGPAILIESPNDVELVLKDGSTNKVEGGKGVNINHVAGSFAGIEVEFEYEDGENPSNKMASLTISGNGSLDATGGENAAGIGGSNSAGGSKGKGLYGNITINSGNVTAEAPGNGAGIGSSDNPGDGTSTGSYKKTGNNTWGTITINGGTVNAKSTASGAGIGGGNHVDSGKIVINGGKVTADGAAGIGRGIGSSKNIGNGGDKGPGYYFADIKITGGDITATSNDIGAAIGGGMYCDAEIEITGGTINATGGSRQGNTHHGGAGIGGGYLGHADITITGGNITAVGGDGAAGIGSGGSPNSKEERGVNGRSTTSGFVKVEYTDINISGGKINAQGGPQGGAGIGLGVGADKGAISITGGDITAKGGAGSEDALVYRDNGSPYAGGNGGAGIGSAFSGFYADGSTDNSKYFVTADVDISITDGNVLAIGGWGASAIGSGANNKTANSIEIDATKADIEAYADGTKFAIDTRALRDDGLSTETITDGRNITGDILQGTFVHDYTSEDEVEQGTEGLESIQVINDSTDESKTLTKMPNGYRSFATNVNGAGTYSVFTDSEAVAKGGGRFFNKCTDDVRSDDDVDTAQDIEERNVQYTVKNGELCDNFYLFPVKSIVVSKSVVADETTKEGVTQTLKFALWDDVQKRYINDPENPTERWVQSIEVVNGIPQSKAFFINVDEGSYGIWELDENGEEMKVNTPVPGNESIVLVDIATRHGDSDDNDAEIGPDVDTDYVTVINTYVEKEDIEIKLTKSIEKYFDASKTSSATFVFKVEAEDTDGETLYEGYHSLIFTKAGNDSEVIKLEGMTGVAKIKVTEVYGAGYSPADGEVTKTIDITTAQKNSDGQYEVAFENTFDNKVVQSSGVINRYENGAYKDGSAVEPAD